MVVNFFLGNVINLRMLGGQVFIKSVYRRVWDYVISYSVAKSSINASRFRIIQPPVRKPHRKITAHIDSQSNHPPVQVGRTAHSILYPLLGRFAPVVTSDSVNEIDMAIPA